MSNRTAAARPIASARSRPGWPLTWRWTVLVVVLGLVFLLLRCVHALATPPEDTAIFTDHVVVVGVTGRYQLTATDRAVLGADLDDVQVGAVAVRTRVVGDCAAAGWETLGAGRRTGVDGLCTPQVEDRRVVDWPARVAAAAEDRGDARLGTLAASVPGCVAAVGPGAALAAARPDGSLAAYADVPTFMARGARPVCPITLVDGGAASDVLIRTFLRQPDVTLYVTGIGPPPGSDDPGLQVIYRVGTTFAGWLTSASTRRTGVVTLTDLTRTLVDFGRGDAAAAALPIDGSPLQVDEATLTLAAIEDHLAAVAALSDAAPIGYATLGIGGAVLVLMGVVGMLRRRFLVPWLVLALCTVLPAVMMLTGAFHWESATSPGLVVSLLVAAWAVLLTAAAIGLARLVRVPVSVAGAALVVAAFTVDAALGGVMEPGSLINSRPIYGLRWYGFGNVTFAAYATAGLVLAGYVAHRFRSSGHRLAAVVSAAIIGFGIVICEGWPSMGTDFGGVIALTPGLLWMLLVLSGVRVTWPKLIAIAGAAVLAIGLISWLDWRRGPDERSHLGNFVQRILDGDALDVVSRKAVASLETIISPVGIAAIILGTALWILLFRYQLPVLIADFSTLRTVAIAVLTTGVLGTLLNDGGIFVWITVTGAFTATAWSLALDRTLVVGSPSLAGRSPRAD